MQFSQLNLNSFLLNALDDLGYTEATEIQEKSFPIIMSGKDLLGIAQTGTGKTFAYLLPILRNLKFSKSKHPRVLILVPTRELVTQIVEELGSLTKYMSTRVVGTYGGTNINTQKLAVNQGCDILISTPGRLFDLASSGTLRLKSIQQLVIDEIDEMLDLGFRPQLTNILDLLPEKRQNLMFSATMSIEVEGIIETFFNRPEKVEVAVSGTPLDNINQYFYSVPNFYTKANLLEHLLNTAEDFEKVLVFVGSKRRADLLHDLLLDNITEKIAVIHSNKSQNQRLRYVRGFEEKEFRILIATDVISRGLDITEISHVINYDISEYEENYMHRIGRTGRAQLKGTAISFVTEKEDRYRLAIEEYMGREIEEIKTPDHIEYNEQLLEDEKSGDRTRSTIIHLKTDADTGGGAFHEKKEKNKKVNLGGSYKREIKAKYKKAKTRGMKPRGTRKKS